MIVVCGEALVDLVPTGGAPGAGPAAAFTALPGGGPANTALALARLGQRVELWTRLGKDALGDLVAGHLGASGVGLRATERTAEPTSLAVVSLTATGEARYHCYLAGTASAGWRIEGLPELLGPEVEAIHTGSLVLAVPDGRAMLAELLGREHGQRVVALDPNVRLDAVDDEVAYRRALEGAVARAHLVRASADDLAALYPSLTAEEGARRWSLLGPRLVVVTRGAAGALALVNGEPVVGPVRATRVVDTVAAGDTFSAALLDHLSRTGALARRLAGLDEEAVEAALAYATAAASLTCARRGADPPSGAEVARLMGA